MDVISWIVGWIILDYPVDGRDIEASGCDVGAQESSVGCIREFKERAGSSFLLLFALPQSDIKKKGEGEVYVEIENGNVDEVEEFSMVFHRLTT